MSDESEDAAGEPSSSFESFPRNPVVQIRFGPRRFGTRFGQTSDDIIDRVHAASQSEMARVVKRDLKRYYDLMAWLLPETSLDIAKLMLRLRELSATVPSVDDLNDWEDHLSEWWQNEELRREFDNATFEAARRWLDGLTLTELVAALDAIERSQAYITVEKMSIEDALKASGLLGGDDVEVDD